MEKPGQVQAIAIYTLVVGILNIILGLMMLVFFFWTIIGIPVGAYSVTVGILEIIYATKILPTPIKTNKPGKYVAIMEIVNVICFLNLLSLAAGILSLVFYSDKKVLDYLQSSGFGPPTQTTPESNP